MKEVHVILELLCNCKLVEVKSISVLIPLCGEEKLNLRDGNKERLILVFIQFNKVTKLCLVIGRVCFQSLVWGKCLHTIYYLPNIFVSVLHAVSFLKAFSL